MFEQLKPLLDSGIVNEETRNAINEAWESKLNEAREQIRVELREEFARRYEHDKNVMVEALDKMVTESLTAEINEFAEEKRALAEDRVKFKKHMTESSGKFSNFMTSKLAEEIKELRADRKQYQESLARLEKFVVKMLAEEIKDFAQDKRAVVETKVRLISQAKVKLAELRGKFIKQSANLVKEAVTNNLRAEMTQLKEDIQHARENMFGRRLFEAYASEFAATHLNENKEIRKLVKILSSKEKELNEAKRIAVEKARLVESKTQEVKVIKESADRASKMAELLKPLNAEKAAIMRDLLEDVQASKLQSAYDKYLPAVLTNSQPKQPAPKAVVLNESRVEMTGDKTAKSNGEAQDNNIIDLQRLAGLK
jgi:hypothetical protein